MEESSRVRLARRLAGEDDVPFLMELRRQTMSGYLAASGIAISEEEQLQRVLARLDCAEIVLVDDQPGGLLKVAREGKNWRLIQIQLLPHLQGAGLGERLIRSVIAEAKSAGVSLELDVLKVNPARRLYERLGFVVVGDNSHSFDMRWSSDI